MFADVHRVLADIIIAQAQSKKVLKEITDISAKQTEAISCLIKCLRDMKDINAHLMMMSKEEEAAQEDNNNLPEDPSAWQPSDAMWHAVFSAEIDGDET